jgi:hypothetical protein
MALKIEDRVRSVMPFHSETITPVYKKVRIPIQSTFEGMCPSKNRRKVLVGSFYEGVNRAFYGGKLNDTKFDLGFVNGMLVKPGIKPDIIDDENDIEWETKGSNFDKECKITHDQYEGYRDRQYSKPTRKFLFSLYRYNLPLLEKQERTEEEILKILVQETFYSIILPLRVISKIKENPYVKNVKLARNYIQREGTAFESCLCIRPLTLDRFLTNPHENLELLDFNPDGFEVQRYSSPIIKVNRRKLRQFPIVKIRDLRHDEWVQEFMKSYEEEMERPLDLNELPLFTEQDDPDLPFD